MNTTLKEYINDLEEETFQIAGERKEKLGELADFIQTKLEKGNSARLTFICTHNSRRTHLCQIWAATLAKHFGLEGIETYSGGTEATAFNPRAVAAIERAGFKVENPGRENPRYNVYFDKDEDPLICFSKTFDDPYNPQENFAAVMTCTDADENCPVRKNDFPFPISIPKESDGTDREVEVYDERCRQIAAEMRYMMSRLK